MGKYIQISELCSWIISSQATSMRLKADITKNLRSFQNLIILLPQLILSNVSFLEATSFYCDKEELTVEKQVIYLEFFDASTHTRKKIKIHIFIAYKKRSVLQPNIFLKLQETCKW